MSYPIQIRSRLLDTAVGREVRHWRNRRRHQARDGAPYGPPDFVGVGAQRSGTTWWYRLLGAHPEIDAPSVLKERHFFDRGVRMDTRARLPLAALATPSADLQAVLPSLYASQFPRSEGRLTGEWTPAYMARPWVAPLLARCAPRTKILVMLRDPLTRFVSGLEHLGRRRSASAASAVMAEALNRGLYADQLDWLGRFFDPSQVLVLQYEQCVAAPGEQLRRTLAFLGVDDAFIPPGTEQVVNAGASGGADRGSPPPSWLVDFYAPQAQRLASAYGIDPDLWPTFG